MSRAALLILLLGACVDRPARDGSALTLARDSADRAFALLQARGHAIAAAFAAGDFAVPGFVHGREVPGTAVMAARRSSTTYTAGSLPGGGQLRLRTRDPSVIAAIHQFLAFQRQDHHAASHGAAR